MIGATPKLHDGSQSGLLIALKQLLNRNQPWEELSCLQGLSPVRSNRNNKISRIQGSLIGLAVGDALGASVEFRPHSYLQSFPIEDMIGGGTWGLKEGQWTDDTSMALCLAASLVSKTGFNAYDQLLRYKSWYKNGYMSSTGTCFDIGNSTRQAIVEFEDRQLECAKRLQQRLGRIVAQDSLDSITEEDFTSVGLDVNCGAKDAAGNGGLMRLAPIPIFYHESKTDAIKYAGQSAQLTHGDKKAVDTCRLYSAMIYNALNGMSKEQILNPASYRDLSTDLHKDIVKILKKTYKNERKNGYADGIRGKGYVVDSLEAALWAFRNDNNSFKEGVLKAVNLGDDTDTTAAIYGQLAGAYYGIQAIPEHWINKLFQKDFIISVANGLYDASMNQSNSKSTPVVESNQIACVSFVCGKMSPSPNRIHSGTKLVQVGSN